MKTPWQHCSNSEHGHLRAAFIYHKLQRYSLIFTKHQMFRDWKCCPHLPERRIPDRQVVCKKPKIEERGAKSLRTTCCPICSLSNSISFSFSIPVNTVWLKNLQYYKAWGRKHLTRLLNLEGKWNRKVMICLVQLFCCSNSLLHCNNSRQIRLVQCWILIFQLCRLGGGLWAG